MRSPAYEAATYEAVLRELYGLAGRGIEPGLERVREALSRLGDPHLGPAVVHVAGTNGKGSVSAMVAALLEAAGLRVGLFTSPHLHRFTERLRIDGDPVVTQSLVEAWARLGRALGHEGPRLTFFEHATLLAFECFREAKVEAIVLEVGLGGRLDATNVCAPRVTGVTPIALDHERWLGADLTSIAREKAGILKPGVPAVVAEQPEEAMRVIERVAARVGAPLVRVGREITWREGPDHRLVVEDGARRDAGLEPPLRGAHQHANLALALALATRAARLLDRPLDGAAVARGLARTRWPGRLEHLPGEPELLLDAAHNPAGARTLAAHLSHLARGGPRVLLFGAMADKDWRRVLDILRPEVDALVFAAPDLARATPPAELARAFAGEVLPSIPEGLDRARTLAGSSGLVVVAGSIFVMAEARAFALGLDADPLIPF